MKPTSIVDALQEEVKLEKDGKNVINLTATPTTALDVEPCGMRTPYPANLSWSGISFQVLDTATMEPKTVLTGCVGRAFAGETVALMGPSGAGRPFESAALQLGTLSNTNGVLEILLVCCMAGCCTGS